MNRWIEHGDLGDTAEDCRNSAPPNRCAETWVHGPLGSAGTLAGEPVELCRNQEDSFEHLRMGA